MSDNIELLIEGSVDDGDEQLDLDYGKCRYIVNWYDQFGRVIHTRHVTVPDGTVVELIPDLDSSLYVTEGITFTDVADSSVAAVVEKDINVKFSAHVVGPGED